jgi:hypothetical protein
VDEKMMKKLKKMDDGIYVIELWEERGRPA